MTINRACRYATASLLVHVLLNRAAHADTTPLMPCPDRPNCVSTQADGKANMPPMRYTGDAGDAQDALRRAILAQPRAAITADRPGYVAAEFRSRVFGFVDAAQFSLNAGVIHFRSGARTGYSDFGVNRTRMEAITRAFTATDSLP